MARSLAHFFHDATFDFGAAHNTIAAPHGDGPITIPDAHLLFSGEFNRSGQDLVIHGEHGQSVIVAGYFASDELVPLRSPEGAILDAKVVQMLAGPAHPGVYAQAGPAAQPQQNAIGRIEAATGSVTVTHADGTVVPAHVGDFVFKGDVVQTGGDSSVGIGFKDGTAFNLSADARMALTDFVFDPNGSGNKALINLIQGTFGFLAGKVAKTGDMKVDTPVATMGIRGTAVYSHVNLVDGTTEFSVEREEDGVTVGSFVLLSKKDGVTVLDAINDPDIKTIVSPHGNDVEITHLRKSSGDVQSLSSLLQGAFNVHHLYDSHPISPNSTSSDHGSGESPQQLFPQPPPFTIQPQSFPNGGPPLQFAPDHSENSGNNGLVPPILIQFIQETPAPHVTPTLSVTISGIAQEGKTLTALPTLTGASDTNHISYQWQYFDPSTHTWKNIVGATQSQYALTENDEGKLIRVETTYAASGDKVVADSAPTSAVLDAVAIVSVTVTGTAQEGQTLAATVKVTGDGPDPSANITYQWQYFDSKTDTWKNIAGATHASYTITEADEGHQIRVEATYSDGAQKVIADSAPTGAVIDLNPIVSASESSGLQQNVHTVVVGFNTAVALNIVARDPDGDNVDALITGLPPDVTLTDSRGDHLHIDNGSILLTPSELAGLTLHTGHTDEAISLTVTAVNVEEGGSTTAPEPLVIDVSDHIALWKAGSDEWSEGAHWTGAGPSGPRAADDALIDVSGKYTATIDDNGVAHSLTISNSGATVELDAPHSLNLTKALTVATGTFDLEGGALSASAVVVEPAGKFIGHGTVTDAVANFGLIESKGGTLEITGDVSGTGTLRIESGTKLQLDGADTNSVTFLNNSGNTGTLVLRDSFDFSGKVTGFTGQDGIDATDVKFKDGHIIASYSHGTLTVSDGTHTANIAFNGNYSIDSFRFSDDGKGGTLITDPANATANASGPSPTVSFDQFGHETFAFQPGFGTAAITNFFGQGGAPNKIELDNFQGVTDFAQLQPLLQATNGGHDTTINLGHGDTIALVNVPVNGLQASDFIIHHA